MSDETERKILMENRQSSGGPPTLIMQSYERMGTVGRGRLRWIGGGMLVFGVGMPMVAELFMPLSWVYWTFSGFVAIAGLCLLWPEMGLVLLDRIAGVLARFLPSKKLADAVKPERRAPRDEAAP